MIPPIGQGTCVYVYVPWQTQKRGGLDLMHREWFRENTFGLKLREAIARNTNFGKMTEFRKPKEWE